jgi:hypothetical protein
MVRFDLHLLAPHVARETFSSTKTELVPVQYFKDRANGNNIEDKVLHILVLACTSGHANNPINITRTSLFGNKKARVNQSSTYNRCFLVADLSCPPNCAMIITRNTHESSALLKLTQGDVFLGSNYYIHEPNLYTQTIGDMPVLSLSDGNASLYPLLRHHSLCLPSTEDKMQFPVHVGDTNYFILKRKIISLKRFTLVTDTSCNGVQCDRQKPRGECTCLFSTTSTSFIYSFDVEFPVPSNISSDNKAVVHSFRSLQTTNIFFRDFDDHCKANTQEEVRRSIQLNRTKVNNMVEYINAHDGWTIVGWFKLGEIVDASGNSSYEKVENYDMMTMHLSYLMPTNINVMAAESFKAMRIGETTDNDSSTSSSSASSIVNI